jgi:hypothetical protein
MPKKEFLWCQGGDVALEVAGKLEEEAGMVVEVWLRACGGGYIFVGQEEVE